MAYITQFYTWATGNTITAARLNGNISNIIDGLDSGTEDINIAKLQIGGNDIIDSSQNITFSGDMTGSSSVSSKPVWMIKNTNADATSGELQFYKLSSSAADNDDVGKISFYGDDSGGTKTLYGQILAESTDVTDTTEDGKVTIYTMTAGTSTATLTMESGAATFGGALTVTGAATFTGGVTFNGGITLGAGDDLVGSSTSDILFNTDKFTVAGSTGNTVIGGTIDVTGAATFTGGVTFNGGITLGAGDDLVGSSTSDILFNTNKFTVAGATGNTVVAGTLGVTGVGTFTAQSVHNGGLTDGTATLDGSGAWTGIASLTVDNVVVNGNDISSSTGNLTLTPTGGSAVVIDGGASFDGTVLTGLSSVTSTAFVGTLSTAAQPNVTSLGTLTTLTVDDVTINGNAISSSGASSLTITATAGQNVSIESVTMDAGVVSGVTTLTTSGAINGQTISSTANFTGTLQTGGVFNTLSTTDSSSTGTGSIQALGGIGIAKKAFIGNDLNVGAGTILVDTANNRLGINDIGPEVTLHVNAGSQTGGALNDASTAIKIEATNDATSIYGGIVWKDTDSAASTTWAMYCVRSGGGNQFLLANNGTEHARFIDDGSLGLGTSSPTAKLHIDQSSSTAAIPVLKLDQGDTSEPFIDFIGTATADANSSISTLNTSGATTDHIQIDLNGTKAWIAVSTNNPT